MRILHVIAGMDPKLGGVCQALRTIIAGLAEQQIHNEVVSLDEVNAPFLNDSSVTVHAIGRGKGPWRYNSRLIPWLLVNLTFFDVVIVHGLWLYPGFALKRAMKKLNNDSGGLVPKLFVMPHGMLDPYFQTAAGQKLQAIKNTLYWRLFESKLINEADGLLFSSEEERLLAEKSFKPYHPKRAFVIGLGIEPPPLYSVNMREEFLKKCFGLSSTPYFLFLSRIEEKKGIDMVVDAYSALLKRNKEKNSGKTVNVPKLVIAGSGLEKPFGLKIHQKVLRDESLRDHVVFTGMISGEAKWGAFYGCDAFILPSHQENFGIAVVEAIACGRPTLISNQVNIWREINDAGACYVADDTLEGTMTLFNLWQNSSIEVKRKMSDNAIECYQNNFSVEYATTRCIKAISETLI
jgi:glycosyltransferase involved in cell wall biosynthesis